MLDEAYVSTIANDRRHLERAINEAHRSLDPNTRVGAVLVTGSGGGVIAWGHNSFPHGVEPTIHRLHSREIKLRLMVHAEMNAILTAGRVGRMTDGCTLYLAATDESGTCWGGPPCVRCAVEVIQAGIKRIVSFEQKKGFSKWHTDLAISRNLLAEAGVELIEVPYV